MQELVKQRALYIVERMGRRGQQAGWWLPLVGFLTLVVTANFVVNLLRFFR